ncbi:MAG: alpha/beta hydrolase [Acidobacteria bacterium]|nr:MAG: alpha/beta hydrolase [Acidobacteriota bacterium]
MYKTEEVIKIDKMALRCWSYRHSQSANKIPFVLLHEGLGCLELWRDFPEQLAKRTRRDVYLFERFGHGKSGKLDGKPDPHYQAREARDVLPVMLDKTGIERALFYGHSDGGTIALLFAAGHPEKAAGIISVAAHVLSDPTSLTGIKKAISAYENGSLRDKMKVYHGDATDGMFWRWARTWTDPEFRDWNILNELPRITCPVLAIQGELDEYGEAAQIKTIAENVSGRSDLMLIPNCRHIPHLEFPALILHKVDLFARSI